jgi:hypothetical protein
MNRNVETVTQLLKGIIRARVDESLKLTKSDSLKRKKPGACG